jgi:two-component system response regulator HydG
MTKKARILVIDDEKSMVENLTVLLRQQDFDVLTALGGPEGLETFEEESPDLVLTDVRMPRMDGVELLQEIRDRSPDTPVVLMTAQASLQSAIQAVNLGATHYIQKPFENEELLAVLRRSLEWGETRRENRGLKQELQKREAKEALRPVGKTPEFEDALEMAETVADSDSTVMIRGESGTGKEVFARYIHSLSPRGDRRFVSLNCAALPENLLESELFGHKKGAFTGAERDKEGLFVAASGGTFFLDEVGEMAPSTQVKLLRVLQQREVVPVGATEPVQVDVRLIAATNRDLEQDIKEGRFREDLYYRLNVISLELPPLRDREDDIPLLAEHLLERLAEDRDETPKKVSADAMEILREYTWPGNVRELENVLERAVVLTEKNTVKPDVLPEKLSEPAPEPVVSEKPPANPTLEVIERAYIEHVLRAEDGNRTRAAETLGIDPSTLYRKINRYDMDV